MGARICDRCRGPMDLVTDIPLCQHASRCFLSFCWNDGRMWVKGSCARQLARDIMDSPMIHVWQGPRPPGV